MKTATLHIRVLEFGCPDCGQNINEPKTGSHMFALEDPLPETVQCECGITLKIPAKAKRIAKGEGERS